MTGLLWSVLGLESGKSTPHVRSTRRRVCVAGRFSVCKGWHLVYNNLIRLVRFQISKAKFSLQIAQKPNFPFKPHKSQIFYSNRTQANISLPRKAEIRSFVKVIYIQIWILFSILGWDIIWLLRRFPGFILTNLWYNLKEYTDNEIAFWHNMTYITVLKLWNTFQCIMFYACLVFRSSQTLLFHCFTDTVDHRWVNNHLHRPKQPS